MRILLVSMYFPPYNAMGSIRAGKMARFLLAQGHDVRVITAARTGLPETLPLEVSLDRVLYTPWWDINGIPKALAKLRRRHMGLRADGDASADGHVGPKIRIANGQPESILKRMALFYEYLFNLPDARIGWLPFALIGARKNLGDWNPDIVYATRPPSTTLIIGRWLARSFGVPWVAELRDRWVDDPYRPYPEWRNRLEERFVERPTLKAATAIITVSEPWAKFYAEKYGKPTGVVYNGFDPADYNDELGLGAEGSSFLKISYTGGIYPGRRDPSALFEALQILDEQGNNDTVKVEFFGTEESLVMPLAARHGVSHMVAVQPLVPYLEAIAIQQRADVLLLMQWNDPKEQGNVPGKLFEYLGARRPILGLGLEVGVPAIIIKERSAGFVSNDPLVIAEQLRAWCVQKRKAGHIAPLPNSVRAGFSRDEQFHKLEKFLNQLI